MESPSDDDETFRDIPLTALSKETMGKLSNFLNGQKIIHSPEGYERDWRGLATLTEQRNLCNESVYDPLQRVLQLWCENKPNTATFGNLTTFLGLIDRWHVTEDVYKNLCQDFRNYQDTNQQHDESNLSGSNQNAVEAVTVYTNEEIENIPNETENFSYELESKVLTSSDVRRFQQNLPLQQYDAFVLYADLDYNYALEILSKLQNNPVYNFTFCLKDDLLFGIPFEHLALMQLIRERCKFLIAILTKEFVKSPENRFFVNYAQALQIQQEMRKVIPLIYEDQVEVPANLVMFSRMRYNPNRTELYWSQLADSMQQLHLRPPAVNRFASTFRPELALETSHHHKQHPSMVSTFTSSSTSGKQKVLTSRPAIIKTNRSKLKKSAQYLKDFHSDSNVSSTLSNKSCGFFSKLFCCRH